MLQPEAIIEARRNAKSLMRKFEEKNKKLSANRQMKIKIKNNHVYVNNVLEKQPVQAPMPTDLFPDPDEQKEMEHS